MCVYACDFYIRFVQIASFSAQSFVEKMFMDYLAMTLNVIHLFVVSLSLCIVSCICISSSAFQVHRKLRMTVSTINRVGLH